MNREGRPIKAYLNSHSAIMSNNIYDLVTAVEQLTKEVQNLNEEVKQLKSK